MSNSVSSQPAEDTYLKHISSLIDGELDVTRLLEVIDRIADTEDCRSFYRKSRALSGLVAAAEPAANVTAPTAIWSTIAARTGLEPAKRPHPADRRRLTEGWKTLFALFAKPKTPNRRHLLAALTTMVLLLALSGLTWVGLSRQGNEANIASTNIASTEPPMAFTQGATPSASEENVLIQLGSNLNMNDSRFIDLATEILQADRRYRRELLRLMSDIEQSSASPSEGLGEGYSNSSGGTGPIEGLERDALGGSGSNSRVRVRMW